MATEGTNNSHLIGLDPKWHPFFDREVTNYESHQLFWVDIQLSELEDEDKILTTLTNFHELINYTKAFDHWRICLKYIEKSENISTFLVCSAGYAKDIARELAFLSKTKVWKVYIYCKSNEVFDMEKLNLTNENKRIYSVHQKLDDLLKRIEEDRCEYFRHERAGIFSDQNPAIQVSVDDKFELWWYNINKVLISLPYPENYHHRLVEELKQHGFTNKIIDEFKVDFPSKRRAVWWYSRPSIFFNILNRAFRQRNMRVLLLFGSFLQDLYLELKDEQNKYRETHASNPIVKLYRGQVLSERDLEKLVIGFPVRSMTLFSSSTKKSVAEDFLETSQHLQDICRIIFEIEIDYEHDTTVFSDVSQVSCYPDECETLFMGNTRFVVQSRQEQIDVHDALSHWRVNLKLQQDYDILRDRKLEAESARKTLKNCLNALSDMTEMISTFDDTVVFDVLMDIYPEEDKWIRAIKLYALAELQAQRFDDPREKMNDYSLAVSYYEQALSIWDEYSRENNNDTLNYSFDIAENYLAMAKLYECGPPDFNHLFLPNLKKAVNFFELALQKCPTTDYEAKDIVYKLIEACTTLAKTDSEEYGERAISYRERWIKLIMDEEIPPKPKSIADHYEHLASSYAVIHRYEDALNYYKRALELYLSNDIESFFSVMDLYREIVTVCTDHLSDSDSALQYALQRHEYCLNQHAPKETSLSECHLDLLAESHFFVADCYINKQEFDSAQKYLIDGLHRMRQRKDLIVKEGRLVIRAGCLVYASDGQALRELRSPDDPYLNECECKIKEKEEKLKHIETQLHS